MTDLAPRLEDSPPPPSPPASEPSGPNRAAIEADARRLLTWMETSGKWGLLDRTVRLLTGRSLGQRSSDILSAAMNLSDDELEAALGALLERTAGYLGVAPPVVGVTAVEHDVAERLVELVRSAR